MARLDLKEFVKQAWHVVQPGTTFIDGWHIDALCDHLTAVSDGDIKKLVINIPPRHMKSLMVSVFWPCWEWVTNPWKQWIYASYAENLAIRDSVKCRRLIQSPWYQERWGDRYQLTGDQNVKGRFETDKQGLRLCTSVGGAITGEGGDFLIIDDPHNAKEAESKLVREGTIDFIDMAWYTRVNNPKTVARLIIAQRTHEKDATWHVLKKYDWEILCLPWRYKGENKCKLISGWTDPRKEIDELIWPDRYDEASIKDVESAPPHVIATQFQQEPYPRGGGYIEIERLRENTVKSLPLNCIEVRGWDLASTVKQYSKRTASVKWAKDTGNRIYIVHSEAFKATPDDRNARILKTAKMDGRGVKTYFELEPGSAGIDQKKAMTKHLIGFSIRFESTSGDKFVRADPMVAQINAGNIYLVDDGTWNVEAFLEELEATRPGAEYLDSMDAGSLGFNKIVSTYFRKTSDPTIDKRDRSRLNLGREIEKNLPWDTFYGGKRL